MFAPIALFVFNRLHHTQQTIHALANNKLALESDLFIFSDGPRSNNSEDIHKIDKLRSFLKTVHGFKSIRLIEQKENIGLANSIIQGVTQVINEYSKIIVVEDDLVTSPHFLNYMNDALDLYENESDVISIHGYIYPITSDNLPTTYFIKGADCWGWATWKRGWDLFEQDGSLLLNSINNKNLGKEFNFNDTYPYMQMLKDQIDGKNNSWAIRWYASAFLHNKITLYPRFPLVENIGFDNSGTHSGSSNQYSVSLSHSSIDLHKQATIENEEARKRIENYFVKNKFFIRQSNFSRLKKYLWKINRFLKIR